jgi:hypothetical protein
MKIEVGKKYKFKVRELSYSRLNCDRSDGLPIYIKNKNFPVRHYVKTPLTIPFFVVGRVVHIIHNIKDTVLEVDEIKKYES